MVMSAAGTFNRPYQRSECAVPDEVPVGVVNLFEEIHVDHHARQMMTIADRSAPLPFQNLLEATTVQRAVRGS